MKKWLFFGIFLSALILAASLVSYFSPGTISRTAGTLFHAASRLAQEAGEFIRSRPGPAAQAAAEGEASPAPAPAAARETPPPSSPSDGPRVYDLILDTSAGPMLYYNQQDNRWAGHLYGGTDPLSTYGCGPTAVAMLVNAFSTPITPDGMADWAAENGYFSPGNGSFHSLIEGSLSAFGLSVQSVPDHSPQNAAQLLKDGHILVALMGKGTFADSGHFILITRLNDDGSVSIADPNSLENTEASWSLDLLMRELKNAHDSGGPLWAIAPVMGVSSFPCP